MSILEPTAEEIARAQAAALRADNAALLDPSTRNKTLKQMEREEQSARSLHATTQLRDTNQNARDMSPQQYQRFKTQMLRAIRGLPPR
ncbi:MAG TPA: hypothetical protein VMA37_06575 [Acetobacteraceae bacterium]|nr:hypothetical protein [Acetobacteraceae bacterium]